MTQISIFTEKKRFPVFDSLYGLFFEDINRAGDGGLYPELLRNRAFDDGLWPEDLTLDGDDLKNEGGWLFEYQRGEGQKRWKNREQPTSIPAWYTSSAAMRLDCTDTLNSARQASLSVEFEENGLLYNTGFCGVPVRVGETYHLYFFAKAVQELPLTVTVEEEERILAGGNVTVRPGGYTCYDLTLKAEDTAKKGRLCVRAHRAGSVTFGFFSLMPEKTYHGHGLRTDLCEMLEALRPAFLRFPGGCIVEGFSRSTALRFARMVGPVWERPGALNLWGYRSTEGLGFHEYLQLCEDLGTDAMYVCNCGMTCQVRQPVYMDRQEFLEDVLAALEYAMGDAEGGWGALRARMGHPEPFKLKYLEIGNENNGPEYEERYEFFRSAVAKRYPDLILIANTHVEEAGLALDIADEHFYNRAEWFAMNTHYFDAYDRSGPGIFVGEFAVVAGDIRTLYPAVGEAMFMVGMERNQDIVKLAAYAPLFENVGYAAWEPNLIAFDGLDHYAIPSYYVWRLFANSRGKEVVESRQECGTIYAPYLKGGPCLTGGAQVSFRGAYWNGEIVPVTREIFGQAEAQEDGSFRTRISQDGPQAENAARFGMEDRVLIVLGEDETSRKGRFEIELRAEEEGGELGIGMFATPYGKSRNSEDSPWNLFSVQPVRWKIRDGESELIAGVGFREERLAGPVKVDPAPGVYHRLAMETDGRRLWCELDGERILEAELPHYEELASVVTTEGNTIWVKLVNFAEQAHAVTVSLDCEVREEYEAGVIAGKPTDRNTMEEPEAVTEHWSTQGGAGSIFVYEAPACSVNVLKLTRKN